MPDNLAAVVLLAHGARDPRWAEPFVQVANDVRVAAPELAVAVAYLEHLPPSLGDAIRDLARNGARSVRIVPLFLGRGGHLREDVPRLVAAIAAELPDVAIEVTLPAGDDRAVQRCLASYCVRAALGEAVKIVARARGS
jgi:sirohydrochlorin cobaltochelatase